MNADRFAAAADDDPYESYDYSRGPGRRTRGPLHEIYEERGAFDRDCPPRGPLPAGGCGAKAGTYCVWPTGELRKAPCVARDKQPKGSRLASSAVDAGVVSEAVRKARGTQ